MGVATMQEKIERHGRRMIGDGNIIFIRNNTNQSNFAIQRVNSVMFIYIRMCSLCSFLPALDHHLATPLGSDGRCVVCHGTARRIPVGHFDHRTKPSLHSVRSAAHDRRIWTPMQRHQGKQGGLIVHERECLHNLKVRA